MNFHIYVRLVFVQPQFKYENMHQFSFALDYDKKLAKYLI